ncbi:MAG: class F sortase [Thermomicrobiales bacterium]
MRIRRTIDAGIRSAARRRWRIALLLCLSLPGLAAALPALAAPASGRAESRYYVEATGHTLGEPFLAVWIAAGGMEGMGLPVSGPISRHSGEIQYFEYGALSIQSRAGKPHTTRIKVGSRLLAVAQPADRSAAEKRVGGPAVRAAFRGLPGRPTAKGVLWNPRTRHSISGRIKSFYAATGGAARWGAPLSQPYLDRGFRVQWFDYGRIETSGSGATVAAPVGVELARASALPTGREPRGSLMLFPADRFIAHRGDGAVPEAARAFTPVTIRIPAIQIDAKIEQVKIVDHVMGVPADPWNVGWYRSLSRPGERTNVVMAAHRDWWGIGPTVFYRLDQLAVGDAIYLIGQNGAGATYRVSGLFTIGADDNANAVIGDGGHESLTLITCGGAFDGAEYQLRQIVRADRI